MLITCDNKGCMKQSNALLDPKTMEVICQECGKPIKNVSVSMKRTLKSFGQFIHNNKKTAFMMNCMSCKANREVVFNEKKETVCGICGNPIKVQASMKLAMEESGVRIVKSAVPATLAEKESK